MEFARQLIAHLFLRFDDAILLLAQIFVKLRIFQRNGNLLPHGCQPLGISGSKAFLGLFIQHFQHADGAILNAQRNTNNIAGRKTGL